MRSIGRYIAATLVLTCAGNTAIAQTSAAESTSLDSTKRTDIASDGSALAEIVVTAQKREQRLQDVPISVAAVSGEAADARGVVNTFDLPALVPGLTIRRENNAPQIFLRGVGTNATTPGFEAAVATYVDGVYLPVPNSALFALSNISRIEVLEGPQGTLFGRNATGGVLNIITRTPDATPKVDASIGYGAYKTTTASLYANGPVSKDLAADISAYWQNQGTGWGRNIYNGAEANIESDLVLRTKWLLSQWENTKVSLAADFYRTYGDLGTVTQLVPPTFPAIGIRPGTIYDVNENALPSSDFRRTGVALTIDHDYEAVAFKSITSQAAIQNQWVIDQDNTPSTLSHYFFDWRAKTFSQELQIGSSSHGRVQWVSGLYYFRNDVTAPYLRVVGTFGQIMIHAEQVSSSIAAYAQGTAAVAENTNLTVGVRDTRDRESIQGDRTVNAVPTLFIAGRENVDNTPTWRASLDHHFSTDSMVYLSYNRGGRSGSFNVTSPADPVVRPEKIDAYEVGSKLDLLNRAIRFNTAAFYYNYRDIQLSQNNAGQILIFNATAAIIKGVEMSVEAVPVRNLTITLGGAFLDGKYKDFPGAQKFLPNPAGAAQAVTFNARGNETLRTPPFTMTASAAYGLPTAIGKFNITSNVYHTASEYADVGNVLGQPAYDVVNGTLNWTSPSEKFEVKAWGRNLLNKEYYARLVAQASGYVGGAAEPRNYGVMFTVHLR